LNELAGGGAAGQTQLSKRLLHLQPALLSLCMLCFTAKMPEKFADALPEII